MYKKILFLCCFYQTAIAQSETLITVDVNLHRNAMKMNFTTFHLRCYQGYIFEMVPRIDTKKYIKPDDVKPPFYNDSSYNFVNTTLHKFVEFNAFTVSAKPTAAQDLSIKPLGIRIMEIPALDSAVRIADTSIRDINYIRYRGTRDGKNGTRIVTAYLLPGKNTTPYSYHRGTEQVAHSTIAWVEDMDPVTGAMYETRFKYESRKIPAQDWKVMRSWIDRTAW